MKKTRKKVMIVLISIISVILVLFLVWILMSPGTIRKYTGGKSLSEKFVTEINGAPNGFFRSPPILSAANTIITARGNWLRSIMKC